MNTETLQSGKSMKNASIQMVSVKDLTLSRNSRLKLEKEDLSGLMQSIKEVGLLQPVGAIQSENGLSICYGNRRYLACSRLGLKEIPVVIHQSSSPADEDLKNLTENIQRQSISLVEAGRYIDLLEKSGLNKQEIATRLGVSAEYVRGTLSAYREVPSKFRNDIEVTLTKDGKFGKTKKGKISLKAAKSILNAKRTLGLTKKEQNLLFEQAKSNDKFSPIRTRNYAIRLKDGDMDPVNNDEKTKYIHINLLVSEKEYNRVARKYVASGRIRSVSEVVRNIVTGDLNEHLEIISGY